MASEKPSEWAKQEANRLFGWRGPLTHDEMVRLATALDAAYQRGAEQGLSDDAKAERKAAVRLCRRASEELSRLKRHDAAGVADTLAGQIECGRHRVEVCDGA